MNQLLNEVNYCTMYSRTQVNCSRQLTRDYGQIRLDRRDGAGDGSGRNPGSTPERSYSSVPASSLTPAERADGERMWQRASTLIERNNYRDAMPLLLQAGRLGNARAQATLGIAYQDGNGVRRDDAAAAHWFALAAAQGHRASQYALAGMYEEGDGGLTRDRQKARDLYLLSANQGFDKAQMEMGMAYEVGDGVPRSRPRAIQMLRASGLGNGIANILSSTQTPAQFASVQALGAYVRRLADEENAKAAARAATSNGGNGPGLGQTIDRINAAREYTNWTRRNEPGYCAYPPCK
jgi:TPR repeat protein